LLEDVLERLGGLPGRHVGAHHIVNDRKEPGRLIELRASILEIAVGVLNLQRISAACRRRSSIPP
jgi:hypothetical protein